MAGMGRGQIYAETRGRVIDVVRLLSAEELERKLPATPLWSPKDVVAHLTGLVADVSNGIMPTGSVDDWTAAQVEARRKSSIEEVIAEWDDRAPAWQAYLDGASPDMSARFISDCYTHEHDIRGGTGRPGGREGAPLDVSVEWQLFTLNQRINEAGLPALRLKAGEGEWTAGDGPVAASVIFPNVFEMVRFLIARRSRAQLAALGWEGDGIERYLDVVPRFAPPQRDLVE